MMPADVGILGIDERTGLVLDPSTGEIRVFGLGDVTVLNAAGETRHSAGATFPASALGPFRPADPSRIRPDIWAAAQAAIAPAPSPLEAPPLAPSSRCLKPASRPGLPVIGNGRMRCGPR